MSMMCNGGRYSTNVHKCCFFGMQDAVIMCHSPCPLSPLAEEEVEVGSLREGEEEVPLERNRQKRLASFIDQTEVIELMVYVDKLLYDRYKRNRTAIERHILAIMNLVCA